MIKKSFHIFVSAGVLMVGFAFILPLGIAAQEDLRQKSSVIHSQKKSYIEGVMRLTPEERGDFWRIYDEYDAGLSQITERRLNLAAAYMETHESLSDAQALYMLNQKLQIDREELEFKQSFVSRFKQVLSGRKVLRLYQTENRFDTASISELYRNIPVIR